MALYDPRFLALMSQGAIAHAGGGGNLSPQLSNPFGNQLSNPFAFGSPLLPLQSLPLNPLGLYAYAPPSPINAHDEEQDEVDEPAERTLFCANLHERVTEEILYECFLQAGPLESVHIPKDTSGKSRSYGFITFEHKCSAPYAFQLYHGLKLFNRPVIVKYKNQSVPPPLPRNPTYSTPPRGRHHGGNNRRNNAGSGRRRGGAADDDVGAGGGSGQKYDNSALRGSNFASFRHDNGINETQAPATYSPPNPFKSSQLGWTKGPASPVPMAGDKDKHHHHQQHQQLRERGHKRSHESDRAKGRGRDYDRNKRDRESDGNRRA